MFDVFSANETEVSETQSIAFLCLLFFHSKGIKMEFVLSTFLLWFLWPTLIGVLAYWYLTRNHGYWKERGIPSVPALPLTGSFHRSFTKPFHVEEELRYKKYGRLFGHYEGTHPVLNVAEPDLLRDILVKDFPSFSNRRSFPSTEGLASKMVMTMESEDWKRVRSIITPAFTTGKLKRMLSIFKDCARTLSDNFRKASKEGKPVNAKMLFGAFSMDIIASSAFSTKLDSHNDPTNTFVVMAKAAFYMKFPWRFILFFLFPKLTKFFKISVFSPKAITFFKDVTIQIIEERKRTGQTRNDFLQLLMDVAKETKEGETREVEKEEKEDITTNYGAEEENNDIFKQYYQNRSLSYDELVAQCIIFFLAGYETTASTLSFVSYNLALNTDVQDRVIQEIDDVIRESGGELTYEGIQKMKYLDNVISETLRMYSPALRLERRAEEDYKLGDTGLTIPKGMIVGIPIYAMHHDPEFFPDPEKFDPDRFSTDQKSNIKQYTYMPFGAGPRNCLGMRLSLYEIKVCLAYVFSNFRVRRCRETKVPLEFRFGQGLLQPTEIKVEFEDREDKIIND